MEAYLDDSKFCLQLWPIKGNISFLSRASHPLKPYLNEDNISCYRASTDPNVLKLITFEPNKSSPKPKSIDCYIDGKDLFDPVSLYHLKDFPLLVNKILQLPPCSEDIEQRKRTFALSSLRKKLHPIEESIIKSAIEKPVDPATLDTQHLLEQAFFCYKIWQHAKTFGLFSGVCTQSFSTMY